MENYDYSKSDAYWLKFLDERGMPNTTPYSGECAFGIDKEMSDYLIELILSGKKTATTSAFEAYEIDNEPIPHNGGYYVIVDFDDNPCGVIQTTKVEILEYKNITWEMAKKEGDL